MNCPKCMQNNNIVVNTGKGQDSIFRERLCRNCGEAFYTCESIFTNKMRARRMINMFRYNKNKM